MKSKIDSPETELQTNTLFCECNTQLLYQVDLDSTETLSQETFIDLINFHKSSKKSFILAVVRSRDPEQLSLFYPFFFDAFHLNKLMFRKKNNILIGRHDKSRPLIVTNPLTNTQIIGEVEYFLVDGAKNPQEKIKAELIGTDYTYISSEKLRKTFEVNALKPEDVEYQEFAEPNIVNFADFELPEINADHVLRGIEEEEEEKKELGMEIRVPFKTAFNLGAGSMIYIIGFSLITSIAVKKVGSI